MSSYLRVLIIVLSVLFTCEYVSAVNRELTLSKKTSGWVYDEPSLLYINIRYKETEEDEPIMKKAIFSPPVDKFAKLEIPDSYNTFFKGTNETDTPILDTEFEVWISGFNKTTTPKKYFIRNYQAKNYIIGSYSAVVYMDKGNVTSLEWVDGCNECKCSNEEDIGNSICKESLCYSDLCTVTDEDCDKMGDQTCNIKVYLAWIGTDANGRPFSSAQSLPNNFMVFGFKKAYRAAAGVDKQYFFDI